MDKWRKPVKALYELQDFGRIFAIGLEFEDGHTEVIALTREQAEALADTLWMSWLRPKAVQDKMQLLRKDLEVQIGKIFA